MEGTLSLDVETRRTLNLAIEHFAKDPHLQTLLESTEYETMPLWARLPKSNGVDSYFSKTLSTSLTIPHCLVLKRKRETTADELWVAKGSRDHPDMIALLALSTELCSHPSIVHGGVTTAVLDEVMAQTLIARFVSNPTTADTMRARFLTVQLNVQFNKPVHAPRVLIVKAWCVRSSGRKYWMAGEAVQLEKGEEITKAEASGLWLTIQPKL